MKSTRPKTAALLLAATALTSTLLAMPALGQGAETLILFDFDAAETPESIVFDRDDNAYITMAFTGEIRRIAPDLSQSTLTFLPIGAPCGPVVTVALGASAYAAGIFHLGTHAFFKALLFLAAGSVIIAMHHEQDMRFMGGLRKVMPITFATMVIGSLALMGTPGFSGFFSRQR